MEIEDVEKRRPPFLWIIVVVVVAAVVGVFLVIRSGRVQQNVARVESVVSKQVEETRSPVETTLPVSGATEPEAPMVSEEPQEQARQAAPAREKPAPAGPIQRSEPRSKPAKRPAVRKPMAVAPSRSPALPTSDSGRFVVQVGSYKVETLARKQVAKIATYGYKGWVESESIPGKGTYYRVRIGGFDKISDARRVAASMEEFFHNQCWVDQRR